MVIIYEGVHGGFHWQIILDLEETKAALTHEIPIRNEQQTIPSLWDGLLFMDGNSSTGDLHGYYG